MTSTAAEGVRGLFNAYSSASHKMPDSNMPLYCPSGVRKYVNTRVDWYSYLYQNGARPDWAAQLRPGTGRDSVPDQDLEMDPIAPSDRDHDQDAENAWGQDPWQPQYVAPDRLTAWNADLDRHSDTAVNRTWQGPAPGLEQNREQEHDSDYFLEQRSLDLP